MVTESVSSRQKKLRRAGLIIGLVGAVLIMALFVALGEEPFAGVSNFLYALLNSLRVSLPFLILIWVAWKQPTIGGILLIVVSLFWPAWQLYSVLATAPSIPTTAFFVILPVSLLPLVSGVLFLLSLRE